MVAGLTAATAVLTILSSSGRTHFPRFLRNVSTPFRVQSREFLLIYPLSRRRGSRRHSRRPKEKVSPQILALEHFKHGNGDV